MKLHASFLLPLLVSSVSAASEASAYIFQGQEWPNHHPTPPVLSPSEARLVLVQRLGVSQYHDVGSMETSSIRYINKFGGQIKSLFSDSRKDKVPELVMIVDGLSQETAGPLLDAWSSIKPAFTISDPPSVRATQDLVGDLEKQLNRKESCAIAEAINPFAHECWNGKSKIIHVDASKKLKGDEPITTLFERLTRFASQSDMNVLVILMPHGRSGSSSYGTYTMPSQKKIAARQQSEEPITGSFDPSHFQAQASNVSNNTIIKTTLPICHASLDACVSSTNNCSSFGACYKKYAADSGDCFACACDFDSGRGGSACQKADISGPFWLIFISSFVLVGLVAWGIGMLYSIGDEKLPGVIGAGVSSKSR